MIEYKAITLTNFKSFKRKTRIELDRGPGLILVTGENGAGKSSIGDALTWVQFGKTTRGARGGRVPTWEGDGQTVVQLDLLLEGAPITLIRCAGPNSVSWVGLDGEGEETPTQARLEQLLGLTYSQWMSTAMMSQFGDYFFDLTPAEKLRVFSEALGLEGWSKRSTAANEAAKTQNAALETLRTKASRHQGIIEETQDDIVGLQEQKREAREIAAKQIEEAQAAAKKAGSNAERKRLEAENAEGLYTKLKRNIDKQKAKLDKQKAEQDRARDVVTKAAQHAREAERIEKAARKAVKDFKDLADACPTCKQPITKAHRKASLRLLDDAHAEAADHVDLTQRHHLKEQALYVDEREKADALMQIADGLDADAEKAAQMMHETRKAYALAKQGADIAELDVEKAGKADGSIDRMIADKRSRLEEVQEQGEVTMQKMQAGVKQAEHLSFWVRGFRDIRLWIIEQALNELEAETNRAVQELGLEGWTVEFDVEATASDGSKRKELNVMIGSPDSDGPEHYQSWSGGETQRLRIAGAAALAALIQRRSSQSTNLEFWDEPTAFLNDQGLDDLVEFMKERAISSDRTVWIIDHRVVESYAFQERLTVVKKKRGSKIS